MIKMPIEHALREHYYFCCFGRCRCFCNNNNHNDNKRFIGVDEREKEDGVGKINATQIPIIFDC